MPRGKNAIKIENRFIQTDSHAYKIIDSLLVEYALPREIIEVTAVGDWTANLWEIITITQCESLGILEPVRFHIINIQFSYDGGLEMIYTLRRIRD